jgi:hypothetical protein
MVQDPGTLRDRGGPEANVVFSGDSGSGLDD